MAGQSTRGDFSHLPLPFIVANRARLTGGGDTGIQEDYNKLHRREHKALLKTAGETAVSTWDRVRREREAQNLPAIPPNIPLFLNVEPDSDLDFLQRHFKFEVVAEHDDGLVIVASEESDMSTFFSKLDDFANELRGATTAAKIYGIAGPENQQLRLERILSESLFNHWAELSETQLYTVDIGIECLGDQSIPAVPEQRDNESGEHFEIRLETWRALVRAAEAGWDDLMIEREAEVMRFVAGYSGEILDILHEARLGPFTLPDSFSVRIKISGTGLRDLVLNYPYLFEVCEPDDASSFSLPSVDTAAEYAVEIQRPGDDAPAICIIDSGIQENHPLLAPMVHGASSRCFIPDEDQNDVADYVPSGGHGTRVAGAVIYPTGIPLSGTIAAPFWIQNARVLDASNRLSSALYPPLYLKEIVQHFHTGELRTKIFNHSIAAYRPCRLRNVSAWAASIDWLSWEYDVLFIQSAGNLPHESGAAPFRLGVIDHLVSGRAYPDYLVQASSRIPSPSESLQALVVGSVAHASFDDGMGRKSLATEHQTSAFSTTGFGIWGGVKPEVVEYGGDFVVSGTPPSLTTPPDVCVDLLRSTMHGGALAAKDDVGTSFAAPKIASIAGAIQRILPTEPALLYRALIANSARWPQWAENAPDKHGTIRQIGFGLPDVGIATSNTEHRVTLITSGENRVKAKEAQIYQVPVPAELRAPGSDFRVRIDVTLSYVAKPRRTRRTIRQYLSTWVDWRSSHLGESFNSFENRVLRDGVRQDDGEGAIPWTIREKDEWGFVPGVKRGNGTLQKDWVILQSHQLPVDFCIAVIGHPGWDKDPDAYAKYALTVSFEAIDEDINIYHSIEAAVDSIFVEPEIRSEVQS